MMKHVPINTIQGNEKNPRKVDKAKFKKLVNSLQEFPDMLEKRPLIIADGVILGGNMRYKAALELGLKTVPVIDASDWTEDQRQQFIIKDNLNFGEWDWDILANEWDSIKLESWGLDVWTPEEEPTEGFTDPDEVPEAPEEPKTKPGDLYILGEHRLLCGDSTKAEDVEKLMNGKKADLCFTSPPYGQQRDYGTAKKIVQDWDALMLGVFSNLHMKEDGQILVNLGLIHRNNEVQLYWENWIQWMREQGYKRFGWYVWNQGEGLPGDWMGRFAPCFEFIFHFNKNAKKPKHIVDKKPEYIRDTTGELGLRGKNNKVKTITKGDTSLNPKKIHNSVFTYPRELGKIRSEHPATFSVAFAEAFINSWPGLVYEPFLGSGTTMIAAEQNNAICYGMELDPKYCDVIVKRWEDFTGKKAVLVS